MVELKLHDIGEGMTEGEVLHYFVKVGDQVRSDQPLVEVQTDKMTAELPSPASGTVKEILIATGNTVEVGTTLLVIEAEARSAGRIQPEKEKSHPVQHVIKDKVKEQKVSPSLHRAVLAAPYTRKIARELGLDIEGIKGSGPAGRVTDEDVYRAAEPNYAEPAYQAAQEAQEENSTEAKTETQAEAIPFKGEGSKLPRK